MSSSNASQLNFSGIINGMIPSFTLSILFIWLSSFTSKKRERRRLLFPVQKGSIQLLVDLFAITFILLVDLFVITYIFVTYNNNYIINQCFWVLSFEIHSFILSQDPGIPFRTITKEFSENLFLLLFGKITAYKIWESQAFLCRTLYSLFCYVPVFACLYIYFSLIFWNSGSLRYNLYAAEPIFLIYIIR